MLTINERLSKLESTVAQHHIFFQQNEHNNEEPRETAQLQMNDLSEQTKQALPEAVNQVGHVDEPQKERPVVLPSVLSKNEKVTIIRGF